MASRIELINEFLDWQLLFGVGHLRCPFEHRHAKGEDSHPSLYVYRNGIYCFGCGFSTSDIITAGYTLRGWTRNETVRRAYYCLMRNPPRIEDKQESHPLSLQMVLDWMGARDSDDTDYIEKTWGICPEVQDAGLIGYAGAFTIPHLGLDGRVYAVKFRRDDRCWHEGPKYWSLKGQSYDFLYPSFKVHQYLVGECQDYIVLCEGEFNALAGISANYPTIAMPSGAATRLDKWSGFWNHLAQNNITVVLAFDGDEAGDRATKIAHQYLHELGVNCVLSSLPEGEDVASFLLKDGALL